MVCTFALKLMDCLHGQMIRLLSRSDLSRHHVLHLGTDHIQGMISQRFVWQLPSNRPIAHAKRLTALALNCKK